MSIEDVRDAIDRGGGQTCNVEGVLGALADAGFSIVPTWTTNESAVVYAQGWFDARDAAALILEEAGHSGVAGVVRVMIPSGKTTIIENKP